MARKFTTAHLQRKALNLRAEVVLAQSRVNAAERDLADLTAAHLAALEEARGQIDMLGKPVSFNWRIAQAQHLRANASALRDRAKQTAASAKRRRTRADAALANRLDEERAGREYRARLIASGAASIPQDPEERDLLAYSVERLLADPGAMLGGGEVNALRDLLAYLGHGDPDA
jgi:hypothetical protein